VFSIFSQENNSKTYLYTSDDVNGYISIQKISSLNDQNTLTVLKTNVNTTIKNKAFNFKLSTVNDTDKMVSPLKIVFDGMINTKIKPVHFTGTRIKKNKHNITYWYFDGDYINELEKDPDFQRYAVPKFDSTLRIPDRTIPSFNMWAIIPKLPFDRKGTFKYNSLDETKLYVKKNLTVNYLGKLKAKVNGISMELHKFVQQGNGDKPTYYWVNNDRVLIQVLLDNQFKFVLNSSNKPIQTTSIP
jgi:hypothetical protein